MSIATIVSVIAFVLSIAAVIWVVRALKRREEMTREAFAFRAMAAYLAFCASIAGSIAGEESTFHWIIRTIRGLPKEPSSPKILENLVLLVLAIVAAVFIYFLHKNWAGAISVEEHRRVEQHLKPGMVQGAADEAKRLLHRSERKIHQKAAGRIVYDPPDIPVDTLSWRLQALDLITLKHPAYHFDVDRDWHPEGQCWIGTLPQQSQTVAVLCCHSDPATEELEAFVGYVKRAVKDVDAANVVLWAAIQEGKIHGAAAAAGFMIHKESEQTLLDDLVDFTYYFNYLKFRAEKQKLADSDKTLAAVYAPSRCVTEQDSQTHGNVEEYLRKWADEPGQRQLALLGEYGQGKSTTALMFAHHLVSDAGGKPSRVPIVIELRGESPRNSTPEKLLAGWAYEHDRIVPKAVLKLIIAGRAIVILEGFDEMALAGDAYARYEHFRVLWRFCYPKAKILFTGRPNYFLDDVELRASLGIDRKTASGPYCESVRLEPFDIEQIRSALRPYTQKTQDEIVSLAESSPKFYDLVSRGSLLYVVGELWERAGLSSLGSNINSAAVMGLFIQSTYDRQAQKPGNFMVLNVSERAYFMSAIAYYMAANSLPNQISTEQFRSVVEAAYGSIQDTISGQIPAASKEPRLPLRQRLSSADDALESVITDVRACALLVSDGSKHGALKFAHKSFMEYLAAEVLARDTLGRSGSFRSLYRGEIIETISQVIAVPASADILLRMPETLLFYCELILNSDLIKDLKDSELRDQLEHVLLRALAGDADSLLGVFHRVLRAYADMPLVIRILSAREVAASAQIPSMMRPMIVLRVCCVIAGVDPRESKTFLGKRFDLLVTVWAVNYLRGPVGAHTRPHDSRRRVAAAGTPFGPGA